MKQKIILYVFLFGMIPLFIEIKAQTENERPDSMWDGDWFDNDYGDREDLDWDSELPEGNFITPATPISKILSLMTYNLQKQNYKAHAQIIKDCAPDVVAIQEVHGWFGSNLNTLKEITGYDGEMCSTFSLAYAYGHALLWNPRLGSPSITKHRMLTVKDPRDDIRAYIVAEFYDFYVISTHLSTNPTENEKMVKKILKEKSITNYKKPVYIIGDLNPRTKGNFETLTAMQDKGFEILNNMTDSTHVTRGKEGRPDVILEKNTNSNRQIIDRRVPENASYEYSDHKPYYVKVRFK